MYKYTEENPHEVVDTRPQQHFSVNIWVCIVVDRLIGAVILPDQLTTNRINFIKDNVVVNTL